MVIILKVKFIMIIFLSINKEIIYGFEKNYIIIFYNKISYIYYFYLNFSDSLHLILVYFFGKLLNLLLLIKLHHFFSL